MHSWLVWLVFAIACVLLGFVGYHFAVHTLRFVTTLFALAVAVVVTRYVLLRDMCRGCVCDDMSQVLGVMRRR